MSGDIEGAICDYCGGRIGPNGCCYTAKVITEKIASITTRAEVAEAKLRTLMDDPMKGKWATPCEKLALEGEIQRLTKVQGWLTSAVDLFNYAKSLLDEGVCILPNANTHALINKFLEQDKTK